MKKIGITGSIGSGKTTVCRVFETLGIPVYNADKEARLLIDQDPDIRASLQNVFGKDIYLPNQQLDRKKMAALVFDNPEALSRLNTITHPPVRAHFKQWVEKQQSPYILKEAALLFESGSYHDLDAVVFVSAPETLRITRTMNRDGLSRDAVLARMNSQWPDAEKKALAQHVIINDEQQLVIPQVLTLDALFRSV